eukprot:6745571-Pyramimonas_sp.AAC.1
MGTRMPLQAAPQALAAAAACVRTSLLVATALRRRPVLRHGVVVAELALAARGLVLILEQVLVVVV